MLGNTMARRALPLLVLTLGTMCAAAAPEPVVMPPATHPGAGQTIYLLMPDRFANGRTDNDLGFLSGGPEETGFDPTRTSHYHGGDFAGVLAQLDYIHGLGATTIWTTPPFRNQPVQNGSAGYHGYWAVDFEAIDPHFGTGAEYDAFVREAHARGMRVYLDIVVNHTADIIHFADYQIAYRDRVTAPYRDAAGNRFDERAVAYNGLNDPAVFPKLSPENFPYVPLLPPGSEHAKKPEWLNDVTLYHNRGNSTFIGENAVLGDFAGLDDIMTEHPRVVRGFIDLFSAWLERGVDGFRIDTMRHVNAGFWQAFNPALREAARRRGRPDFLQFGEVMNEQGDVAYLSEFTTGTMPADAITDFGFAAAARKFVSQGGTAAELGAFFAKDDYYTDHDSNAHANVTLLGNYDIGRWGYFLLQDNPGAPPAQLADLVRLGHGLMYLARGMPALYYGDEQGMLGRGGNDQQAREDLFASHTPAYRDAPLLATSRTGADDKFDPAHPFYRLFEQLGKLRADHPALRTGAMRIRPTSQASCFAFSRLDRNDRVEYLAVFNNSRSATLAVDVPTSQPGRATLRCLLDSRENGEAAPAVVTTDERGRMRVTLAPLQFSVWQASAALPSPTPAVPSIRLVTPQAGSTLAFRSHEIDGLVFPGRQEIRAEVSGTDGWAEVTFCLTRRSRPGQSELLGVDDAPPYRIFWSPPADLAPNEELTFVATVNDLRGRRATTQLSKITVGPRDGAAGIPGASNPTFAKKPPATLTVATGSRLELIAQATGSGALEYQWYRNDQPIPGATGASYLVPHATPDDRGRYRVAVHNLAGTTVSSTCEVTITPAR